MSELNTSKLLSVLIEASKRIGNTSKPPFTAERFVVAVIDMLNSVGDNIDEDMRAELSVLGNKISEAFGNLGNAKQILMSYICQGNNTAFLDDLYMQKKIKEATQLVLAAGEKQLDAMALMLCILSNPSNAIKNALNMTAQPTPTAIKIGDNRPDGEIIKDSTGNGGGFSAFVNGADKSPKKEETAHTASKGGKTEVAELIAEVKRVRSELQSVIFGQDNAINVFTSGYFQSSLLAMTDKSRRRPRATFLFAGPPGVGKTFMAEKAAELLKLPFKRFDMSEYAEREAVLEFCGSDDVYKNAKEGNVTGFVAQNPKCVLLFDEIEKAHLSIIHLFLQLLDAGKLRDSKTDKEVSFADAIIILTTNAGRQIYKDSESEDFSGVPRKVIIKALQNDVNPETKVPFFPAALCSRFATGNVVMFNHIGAYNLRSIAEKEITRHATNFEAETGIKLQIDDRVYTALLFSEGSSADARNITGRSQTFFNDEIYELMRLVSSDKAKTEVNDIEQVKIDIDLSRADKEITELFDSPDKTKALVFADDKTISICKEKAQNFEIFGVQNLKDAVGVIKNHEIDLVLLDIKYGAPAEALASLNVEDVESPARDFFKLLKGQGSALPIYLLEEGGCAFSEEERVSFARQGVRGFLCVTDADDSFADRLSTIAGNLYQQASMVKLAKANKLVSFETAQKISEDGKCAEITLFDFKLGVAVDPEDAKNILSSVSKPNVRFDDVIGAGDAKKELEYFVNYLKNPKKYMGTGVKAPKGVILYGPPGTGKTMLAKAMACEADITFIAAEGNEFLKSLVGEGSERVHELFRTARKYAPSILFIDEIDAIAKERQGGMHAAANGEGTLTAFLTEMDGFASDPTKPVFVLAATNFDVEPGKSKSLDPALMRRFDRRVYIDLPNKEDRIRFLNKKMEKNHALDISSTQVDNIAMRSTGMSLADLDSVVELALRSAIREGSTVVTDAILEEAFETFNNGETKKWDIEQLERVARHESGHALLCWMGGETPSYLTIVARGDHGGYMQHADKEGKAIHTKEEMLARIRTSLGGRAAEIVYYGENDGISTGASGDLASATRLAQYMVCTYGMDDEFGLAVVNGNALENGEISVEVRRIVNRILKEQMDEAVRLISENKDKIDSLVEELMTKNHLNGAEIEKAVTR